MLRTTVAATVERKSVRPNLTAVDPLVLSPTNQASDRPRAAPALDAQEVLEHGQLLGQEALQGGGFTGSCASRQVNCSNVREWDSHRGSNRKNTFCPF